VTAVGRAAGVVIGGVFLTLIAFTFDSSPLFVPGVAFVVVGFAAPAWVWLSARGTTLTRRLRTDRIVEEEPLEATIEVRRGALGVPGAQIVDPLVDASVPLGNALSPVRGGRTAEVRIVATFSRRGLHHLAPPALIVQDPLELARIFTVAAGPPQELLVLPRTEPVRWSDHDRGAQQAASAANSPSEPLAAVDVDGLRPYRPGTPASRIHWPAVARGAGLLERRLRADGDTRPLVVLDARTTSDELLDSAVRAAASLTLELARRGGCGLLLPGERRAPAIEPELGSWPAAHARLAVVEGGPGVRPPVLAPGGRLGQLFYVAAQPLSQLRGALTAAGRGGCVFVLPHQLCDAIELRPSFEVAGCYGFAARVRAGSPVTAGRAA
jgi:uncharacterized protein (DUF58 family)